MSELRYNSVRPSRAPGPYPEGPQPDAGVEAAQLWNAIRTNWGFIVKTALLVTVIVLTVTFASRMRFKPMGRLYLGETEHGGRPTPASSDLALAANQESQVASEMEILRSESLVTRAILQSGLNATIVRPGQWATRYLPWLISGRDPALVDGIFDEITITDARTLNNASRQRQRYKVRLSRGGGYEVWSDDRSVGKGKLGEPLQTSELSWTLARGLKRTPADGAEYEIVIQPLDRVLENTMKDLDVSAPKQGPTADLVNVVTLEFRDTSPRRAAAFLEDLIQGYLGERQSWKTEDASAAEAFVGEQLQGIKETLDEIQHKLADFRTNNEVVVLGKEGEAMIEQLGTYEERRLAARLEVAALAEVKHRLARPNPPVGAFLMGEASDTVLQSMGDTLQQERAKLADLQTRFSDAAPDVREQQARVNAQLANVRGYVETRLSRAQDNLSALSALIKQVNDRLKSVPGAELGLAQLARESEVYSKTYSYLLERQQQAAIAKASTLSKNRVIDAPQPPPREDSPKLLLRLASFFAGLLLGVAVVVVRSIFSDKFQSEADVQRGASDLPLFGIIPAYEVQKPKRRVGYVGGVAVFQAFADAPHSAFAEALRTLRAGLRRWVPNGGGCVLLVTSPSQGDGKTTIALGLAAVLAAESKRVLVLDTHQTHVTSPPDPAATLNSILNGKRLWEACVWRASLPFAVLDLIHAGPPSSAGDLHENRKHLLGELRQAFDFIVIDSAAFPPTSDVLSWAELADGVLSVMRLQHTPRSLAKDHLARVSGFAQSFAVIINDAPLAGRPRVALTEIVQEPAEVLAQSNEITRTGPIGGSSRAAASDVQELLTVLPGGHQTPVPTRWDRLGRKSD